MEKALLQLSSHASLSQAAWYSQNNESIQSARENESDLSITNCFCFYDIVGKEIEQPLIKDVWRLFVAYKGRRQFVIALLRKHTHLWGPILNHFQWLKGHTVKDYAFFDKDAEQTEKKALFNLKGGKAERRSIN